MTPAAAERAFAPRTAQELSEIVRSTAGDDLALVPVGAGTQLALGNRVERCDATVSTREMARIVEYSPED